MNAFQSCPNTSDLVPLYLPQQLYLKPIARLNISLQLPNVKKLGKSVSHWEIMDKLRDSIKPDEFTVLKVTKTTIEFVRFEGEVETKTKLQSVVLKLNNKMIKLKDFSDLMRIRAAEWKSDFPNRRVWDDFFQNSKDMNEMKPGERPDTMHLSNLPSKWFIPYHLSGEQEVPSEKIFQHIFAKFGKIRYVDIPICDPYRKKMKDHISGIRNSSIDKTDFFEGYVQFKDYIGFTKAMDAFRDMKLVHKDDKDVTEVIIKVDFDKSKHLTDATIRRREIVRDRLIKKAKEREEKDKAELEAKQREEEIERQREVDIRHQKELRRKLREEKRKAKILEKLEVTGTDEINEKIAKEEKKLLRVQRKLEAIRLLEELFKRIKDKSKDNVQVYDNISNAANDELRRFKNTSELEVLTQREKLHHAIKGRVMLKSILSNGTRKKSYTSSSDSSLSLEEFETNGTKREINNTVVQKYPELLYDPAWYGYHLPSGPLYPDFPAMRGVFPRGRMPFPRFSGVAGPSRGNFNRRRGNYQTRFRGNYCNRQYPPDIEEEYQKYFSRFLNERDHNYINRRKRSYSTSYHRRTRSRSNSSRRSYSRSSSRSRSRRRSNRSRSRSYRSSRDRSKSRRSYSRSRSRNKSISRDRSRSRSSRKASRKKCSNRTSSQRTKSGSREKSVDSAAFMTPKQFLQQKSERSRSKSWSLPKDCEKNKERSWSKSPEKKDCKDKN